MNSFQLGALNGVLSQSLKPDNTDHRKLSNDWDNKFSGEDWYDKAARPIVHGVYHAARATNDEEISRAKIHYKQSAVDMLQGRIIDGVVDVNLGHLHAIKSAFKPNKAELARAKDQFSKIGTGQQRTEYLEAHNANKQKRQ